MAPATPTVYAPVLESTVSVSWAEAVVPAARRLSRLVGRIVARGGELGVVRERDFRESSLAR